MLRGTGNPDSYMNGSCGLRRLAESSVAKSKKDHMREHTREHRIRISSRRVRRTVSRRKAWLVRQAFGISVVKALQLMAFVA